MSDLIERQVAIDAFWKLDAELRPSTIDAVLDMLKSLPSAQPERKTTHWVPLDERFASWSSYYKCSECGFRINLRTVTDFSGQSVNYCPHCGLRMEVENETD